MQAKIAVVYLLAATIGIPIAARELLPTQDSTEAPTITVRMIPPEPIPSGTCKESKSGFLGIEGSNDDTSLTPQQIGEYVEQRLSEGYSLQLYPQNSGRIYAIAKCESAEATASR